MQNKHRLLFSALLLATALQAQHGLRGRATDHHGNPLPFASVSLRLASDSTWVRSQFGNETGHFEYQNLPQGQYALRIRYLGYADALQTLTLSPAQTDLDLQQIALAESGIGLGAVEVSTRRSLVHQKADRTVVNVQQLASAAGGTVLELISQMPNVSVDRQQGGGQSHASG
jgi:hypothetical protein